MKCSSGWCLAGTGSRPGRDEGSEYMLCCCLLWLPAVHAFCCCCWCKSRLYTAAVSSVLTACACTDDCCCCLMRTTAAAACWPWTAARVSCGLVQLFSLCDLQGLRVHALLLPAVAACCSCFLLLLLVQGPSVYRCCVQCADCLWLHG